MSKHDLEKILEELGQPKFRLKQIQKAIYQDGIFDFSEMTNLPKELREELKKEIKVFPFKAKKVLEAKDGESFKALLELEDGKCIETVLISPKPDEWSVCISSQAGCPLGCAFCATGQGGFKRNLTAEEITGQVLFWMSHFSSTRVSKKEEEKKISSVVFMGMGEPFLNWENVHKALEELHDPELFGFGWRSLSVSTSGVPDGIGKMAREFPQANLALSLHFADDKKRSEFMPISRKYNLTVLRKALQNYFSHCRRKVFVEYIMFSGLNDGRKDAEKLVNYLQSIEDFYLLHINLIPYNGISRDFFPPSPERIKDFKSYLLKNGISATIRKSVGQDIQGACGQLAGK